MKCSKTKHALDTNKHSKTKHALDTNKHTLNYIKLNICKNISMHI